MQCTSMADAQGGHWAGPEAGCCMPRVISHLRIRYGRLDAAWQGTTSWQCTTVPYLEGEQLAHEQLVGNDGERKHVNLRAAVQ